MAAEGQQLQHCLLHTGEQNAQSVQPRRCVFPGHVRNLWEDDLSRLQ